MKTNKIMALISALSLMIIAQPALGMHFVNKGVEKAKKHWKPIAGAVAIFGIGYGLWTIYSNKQAQEQKTDTTSVHTQPTIVLPPLQNKPKLEDQNLTRSQGQKKKKPTRKTKELLNTIEVEHENK